MVVASAWSKETGRVGRKEVANGMCLRTYMFTYHTEFDPEDGFTIYVRNIGNSAHVHVTQRPKNRTTLTINQNESPKLVSVNSCSLVLE
jgi:DNA-binding beta-propeller fold protein YncE